MDNYEEIILQDHAMLTELLAEKRRQERAGHIFRIIMYCIITLMIIGIIALVPIIKDLVTMYRTTMTSVNELTAEVNGIIDANVGTLEKIKDIDIEQVIHVLENCNKLFEVLVHIFSPGA
ncbi:MAG: hypothetical protein IIY75_00960 [Erysipelotrichales bacterium]|nr:hypothetical protein [Erysipelotrichales bacterium]